MLKKILAVVLALFTTLAMAAVDVNKATEAQLDAVNGIGPVTSKLIMAERKKGEFKNWQDFIDRVKGIGEARAAKLSADGLTVGGTSYKPAATKATAKEEKKDAKAAAKDEKKDMKAAAKEEKKEAKAAAKDAKKDAKDEKPMAKADTAKPAASAAKAPASRK
jgi:competence protein ComEA